MYFLSDDFDELGIFCECVWAMLSQKWEATQFEWIITHDGNVIDGRTKIPSDNNCPSIAKYALQFHAQPFIFRTPVPQFAFEPFKKLSHFVCGFPLWKMSFKTAGSGKKNEK